MQLDTGRRVVRMAHWQAPLARRAWLGYRLIAYIRFDKQILYIKSVLTHRDYDKGTWKT